MNNPSLKREVGVTGAVLLGLGSILGTGVFVSLGIAVEMAGSAVILAVLAAALIALCNGLNSAQLAASHPVSGGTYEYGYKYLNPLLGFSAGWLFLFAKSASAATAALGFSAYLMAMTGWPGSWTLPVALGILLAVTLLVLSGLKRSNWANAVIVSVVVAALAVFVAVAFSRAETCPLLPSSADGAPTVTWNGFYYATAFLFVAYTGYGRIATLGEEVRDPARSIPRAVIVALVAVAVLYAAVAAAVLCAGSAASRPSAYLQSIALEWEAGWLARLLSLAALIAMVGVLLNLVLGLSRVVLAMGRRGDAPPLFSRLDPEGKTPVPAVWAVTVIIGLLVLIGNVRLTWSFSAFLVLLYYAITNLCALRLPDADRKFPRWIAAAGLASCLFFAFGVDPWVWGSGIVVILAGLVWHALARRLFQREARADP